MVLGHYSRFPGAQKRFGKVAVKFTGPCDLDSIFRVDHDGAYMLHCFRITQLWADF